MTSPLDDTAPPHGLGRFDLDRVEFVLCDLDGVVWLNRTPIPGAAESIERLRASGRRVLFVTNNSVSPIAEQEAALAAIGVPATGDVVTSAQAAASLVSPGTVTLVCGGAGIVEAVEAMGAQPVSRGDADVVIVGLDRNIDYEGLHAASRAIRRGARFVATNDDATFPTPDGPTPGAGAIVAAVATAAGAEPEIAGKPHPPMAALVAARCGERFSAASAVMIGDRWSTDGRFAEVIGCPFAMVRSGVTPPGADRGGAAAIDVPDLPAVVDVLLGGTRPASHQ